MKAVKKHLPFSTKVFICILLLLILAGSIFTRWTAYKTEQQMREDFLLQTFILSEAFNIKHLLLLNNPEADMEPPVYERVKRQLIQTHLAFPQYCGMKIMGQNEDGSIFIIMDSQPEETRESAHNVNMNESAAIVRQVFSSGESQLHGSVDTFEGSVITTVAPLLEPQTGEVIAALSIDFDAGEWQKIIRNSFYFPIISTLVLIGILTAGAFCLRWRFYLPVQQKIHWLPRYIEAMIVAAFGLSLTIILAIIFLHHLRHSEHKAFVNLAQSHTAIITDPLRDLRDYQLESLGRFYESSVFVDRQEFNHFTEYLTKELAVLSWDWIPGVPYEERFIIEQMAHENGLPDFMIWQEDLDGTRISSPVQKAYYPIFYSEPLSETASALGFNLASQPHTLSAIAEAAKTKLVTATQPYQLPVQEQGKYYVRLFRPVSSFGTPPLQEGFVSAVLNFDNLLEYVLKLHIIDEQDIILDVYQLNGHEPPLFLATTCPDHIHTENVYKDIWHYDNSLFTLATPLFAYGKVYIIMSHPGPHFAGLYQMNILWLLFLPGILLTVLLAVFIGYLGNRRIILEREVKKQTLRLRESEQHFRTLADSGTALIWTSDKDKRRDYFNTSWLQFTGQSLEHEIGNGWTEGVHPADQKEILNTYTRAFEKRENFKASYRLRRFDGQYRWILEHSSPRYDTAGNFLGYIGHCLDITETRQREKEQEEKEKRVLRQQAALAKLSIDPAIAAGDIPNAKKTLAETAAQALQTDRVSFWLFADDKQSMHCIELFDASTNTHDEGALLKTEHFPQYFKAIQKETRVNASDARTDPRTMEFLADYLIPHDIMSMLDAGIFIHGKLAGVTCCEHTKEKRIWQSDEESFVSTLSSLMAQIILNAERKKAESELRQSEKKYRELIESTEAIAWEYNILLDKWTYVAPKSVKLLGYHPEEWTDLEFWINHIHPEDREWASRYCKECTERGENHTFEYRFLCKNGEYVWLRDVACVDLQNNKPTILRGYMLDITSRKKAEERVLHLDQILRAMIDINRCFIQNLDAQELIQKTCNILVEIEGYDGALIILKDDKDNYATYAECGTGYNFTVMKQKFEEGEVFPCWEQMHSTRDIYVNTHRNKYCAQCTLIDNTVRQKLFCVHLQHEEISYGYLFVSLNRNIIIDEEEITIFSAMAEDLTAALVNINLRLAGELAEKQRKQMENHLRQSQKLEAIGRLAGGVAHDFNNMLGIIIGNAEMIAYKTDESAPLQKNLKEILDAANQSASLTKQLLAFARKQTVNLRILNLNDIISGMISMLQRLIGEDIILKWLPGKDLWKVKIDPVQVHQILVNLCVNARDAISEHGEILIETKNIILDQNYCDKYSEIIPGNYVLLSVTDSGCGIEQAAMKNIFDPFYTSKSIGRGTGLGLPMVYGTVKQSKGFINVYSEEGSGTTFKIYLPRHLGPEKGSLSREDSHPAKGGTEAILVVEDDTQILFLIQTILSEYGYKVVAANSPLEAINIFKKHNTEIQLVITDMVMPGINGVELKKELEKIAPNLKVLFMSGYAADVIKSKEISDTEFIQKPFSIEEFCRKVREILDS